MYKKTVEIDSIKCTIFYDQDIDLDQKQEIDFIFKIEDDKSYSFENYPIRSTVVGHIFRIESILPIGDSVSTSSSLSQIPKYDINLKILEGLSQFHLENHLRTLELVHNHRLDKDHITDILKEKLNDFFYHK